LPLLWQPAEDLIKRVDMKKYSLYAILVFLLAATNFAAAQGMGMMGWGFRGEVTDGPWNYKPRGNPKPLTISQVGDIVASALASKGNSDLQVAEVMQFSNHFYAEVEEKSTKIHAFELLINKYTGDIFPEPGPNMMWNQKYGHMAGGMMGGGWGYGRQQNPSEMPVTPAQARADAQAFLDANYPGVKVEDNADRFYGYYTLHVLKDGKTYGMLGVNGYTGQVWYHSWHGTIERMTEMD
jgi:hypothetical protein